MRLKMKYIALAALVISIIGLWWGIDSTQASIDYWLQKPPTLTAGENSITMYCKNGGQADGSFNLVLHFVNASFSNQTTMPYTVVDNSTMKCGFTLHKDESNQKKVYFTIHENVTSLSIELSLEKRSTFLKQNRMYPTALEYKWDEEKGVFAVVE